MFSDSSSDSDSGIRFKTTTTRQVDESQRNKRLSSPPKSNRRPINSSYERSKDSYRHRNNDSRNDDRRSSKYSNRKSSPEPYHRRKVESRDERSRNRDRSRSKSRSRSRQESRKRRSPEANRNGKIRSTSIERRHTEQSSKSSNGSSAHKSTKDEVKNSSSRRSSDVMKNTHSSKAIKHDKNDDANSTRTVSSGKTKSKDEYYKVDIDIKYKKEDSVKNDKSDKNGKYADEKQVNISNSKRHQEHTKSCNDVLKNREHVNMDKKDSMTTERKDRQIIVNEKIYDKRDIEDSHTPERNEDIKKVVNETDVTKIKPKKSKHSKHGKKHKKKKVDLSEGELTPSDNDISFNESELDKTSLTEVDSMKSKDSNASGRRQLGPEIPKELRGQLENAPADVIEISDSGQISSDDEAFGPLPLSCSKKSKAHLKLEERALRIRLDKLDEHEEKDEKIRDEWMLELPDVKAAHLGLGPRQFRAREGPDMSDRSSWTDTPQSKANRSTTETESQMSKRVAEEAHRLRIREKDAKQEKLVKKHKKKHKRDESLLEMHQKKLLKKKKKEKDAGLSTERRRFDRDVDLGVNRFDEAQKKSIFKKAQLLDTRFSSGESKFL